MKKGFKKLISLLLIAVMTMGISSSAFAMDTIENKEMRIRQIRYPVLEWGKVLGRRVIMSLISV